MYKRQALADVLVGQREPGGRLPVTFPVRQEHAPSHGNFPGSNGVVRYGEGVFIGHRWYQERRLPVSFPFGHGLSYASFEFGPPTLDGSVDGDEQGVTVSIEVTNVGDRAGSEVVQCYVAPPAPAGPATPPRPPLTLQGLAKVALEPGASELVTVALPARAFSRWHDPDPTWEATVTARAASLRMFPIPSVDRRPGWVVDPGTHEVVVARSSVDEIARLPIDVEDPIHL